MQLTAEKFEVGIFRTPMEFYNHVTSTSYAADVYVGHTMAAKLITLINIMLSPDIELDSERIVNRLLQKTRLASCRSEWDSHLSYT